MKFTDNKQWRFYAAKDLPSMTYQLYWMAEAISGQLYQRKLTAEEIQNEPHAMADPTMAISYEEATSLMTELWNAGCRPTGIESTQGEVAALKAHIASQQKTVNSLLVLVDKMTVSSEGLQMSLEEVPALPTG